MTPLLFFIHLRRSSHVSSMLIPPRDLRSTPRSMGPCGHALVAVTLCCVCGFVAGIDLDEVMAALPAEARALLSKQNAEVTKMTDTICASP